MVNLFYDKPLGGGIINNTTSGTATFNVDNCLVDFYQRNGIVLTGANLTAHVSNNTVNRGYVLTPSTTTASPNGISFGTSATGSITNNTVLSNIATVLNASSTAINISSAGANLTVSGNTVTNNDIGIFASSCGNNIVIENNNLSFNTTPGVNVAEGIIVRDTAGLSTITGNIIDLPDFLMELLTINGTNQPFTLANNQFINGQTGLLVYGKTGTPSTGPIITMNGDSFSGTGTYYIREMTAPYTAPNDMWPSTATVSFDGLLSGHITMSEYNQIMTKIVDKNSDSSLGLVLDFITPSTPVLSYISPLSGPVDGGNEISISGTGFISSNTNVNFGSNAATNVIVVSDILITANAPAGSGMVDVRVTTPFGTTPIVHADKYTYIAGAPSAPSSYTGVIKTKYNKPCYVLVSEWTASPSSDVILYRIYQGTRLVDEILAGSPLISYACMHSKISAVQFNVVAVNEDNVESAPVMITIIED